MSTVAALLAGGWFRMVIGCSCSMHGGEVWSRQSASPRNSASLDSYIAIEASLLPHSYIHRRLECFLGFNRQPFAARIFRREVVNSSLPRAKRGETPTLPR